MVIDSQTLMLAAANFFVTSIGKGDRHGGGGRHRMASAVAQQAGGCFVVKASEKDCGTAANPPAPNATFDVFCNRKVPEKVLIIGTAEEALSAEAETEPSAVIEELRRQLAEKDAALAEKDDIAAECEALKVELAAFKSAEARRCW